MGAIAAGLKLATVTAQNRGAREDRIRAQANAEWDAVIRDLPPASAWPSLPQSEKARLLAFFPFLPPQEQRELHLQVQAETQPGDPAMTMPYNLGARGILPVPAFRQQQQQGCVLVQDANGQLLVADGNGNQLPVLNGAQFGAAYDDDDDDDDYDVEDFSDIEDEIDELFGAAWVEDDASFGAREDRLRRKLARKEEKLEKLKAKKANARPGSGRARRLARKIDRTRERIRVLKAKLNEGKRERQVAEAAEPVQVEAAAQAANRGLRGRRVSSIARRGALPSRQGLLTTRAAPLGISPIGAHNVRRAQSAAGMRGNFVAPPGSGRLVRIPMSQSGTTNPRNALTVPAALITSSTTLYQEDIPYATVQIVGFVASTFSTDADAGVIGLVADFKTKGSGNLFLHEEWSNAANYDTSNEQLVGLRDNPEVRSPNLSQVDVAAAGGEGDILVITCDVVVDILQDDSHGPGLRGAYAG